MPNALNLVEARQLDRLDRQRSWATASDAVRPSPPPRSPPAMHFDTTEPPPQQEPQQVHAPPAPAPEPQAPPPPPPGARTTLVAKTLKVSVVLDPVAVSKIPVRPGDDRIATTIRVGGRTVTADLNAKSVRKARSAIAEHGVEGVAAVLQGKLMEGDVLAEAGLAVQPKTPKPP